MRFVLGDTTTLRGLLCAALLPLICAVTAAAQVQVPDHRWLFEEDMPQMETYRDLQVREALQVDPSVSSEIDINAPEIRFNKETNEMEASGGVLISQPGVQIQAEDAVMNTETKDLRLKGGVLFTWPEGEVSCDSALINTDTELGTFDSARLLLEGSDYQIVTEELEKLSQDRFSLGSSGFTTCHCPDGSKPWAFDCSKAQIRQEGYARTYNTVFRVRGVPIFYTPYLVVPIMQERHSGLLPPDFGYSTNDGLKLDLPIFVVFDEHSDALFEPFVQSKTRTGASVSYRQIFSRRGQLSAKGLYSDESAREGDLRGSNTDGMFDPDIDEERLGGYYLHRWKTAPDAVVPTYFIADGHYVSDSLFLREIDDSEIGPRDARFLTSQASVQSTFGSYISARAMGDYSQSFYSDPDLTFQRLPELDLNYSQSFRPFGYNPYGVKLATGLTAIATRFERDLGYRGTRYHLYPSLKVPHHYKNYVNAALSFSAYDNYYDLTDSKLPGSETEVSEDNLRVPRVNYRASTAFERVFQLERSNPLVYLSSLGSQNQGSVLRRVKNIIEPTVSYTYVPDKEQDSNPLFDPLDRLRSKNLVAYGFTSTLLGRFVPTNAAGAAIPELTPDIVDLPPLETTTALPDLGDSRLGPLMRSTGVRRGDIRRLATFSLFQTYDYNMDSGGSDSDPEREPFSDIGSILNYYVSQNFAFEFDGNLDPYDWNFASWGFGAHLRDDRGDLLRARYSYINDQVSQLETNAELVLTDRLSFGYYARYDNIDGEFLQNSGALRYFSACDCWSIDVGVTDRTNPDDTEAFITFTLAGLGNLTQSFGMANSER